MAILLDEPGYQVFIASIAHADDRRISAGSVIELTAVTSHRRIAPSARDRVVASLGLTIEPVTAEQARIGQEAYRHYGLGSGHRARLNLGDCFAYALAKATGEPLLFKGNDFIHTDIVPALAPSA